MGVGAALIGVVEEGGSEELRSANIDEEEGLGTTVEGGRRRWGGEGELPLLTASAPL